MIEGPTWPTLMITLACFLGSCKTGRTKHRVLQAAAAQPVLLSRRQPAGQKGCRHKGKLTKDTFASQKAISADTPYALLLMPINGIRPDLKGASSKISKCQLSCQNRIT